MNIGETIRQRRMFSGLTLRELSARSGVSGSHIGRIERGERFPSASVLKNLAQPLGFGEAELLTLAGYLSQPPGGVSKSQLDPFVAAALSQESVEMQRTAVVLLSILKSIARGL